MSTSSAMIRFATLLFLLAGLLLLRKPLFGQPTEPLPVKPAHQSINTAPSRFFVDKAAQVILKPWETESALTSYTSNPETDKG
jgi:hypothetical protein